MPTVIYSQQKKDYELVEKAIQFIDRNFREQPELEDIADQVHVSKYHFQRIFTRWAGISPKKFLQYITIARAKELLGQSKSVLDVTYDVGLSSPSRLYDLFVNFEALTPGEYKLKGRNLSLHYGYHLSPFGECLLGSTNRGICWLSFIQEEGRESALTEMKKFWKEATLVESNSDISPIVENIFNPFRETRQDPMRLLLKGTNFQIKVWEALLKIPFGFVVSYSDIAKKLGMPTASRAVGNAVGRNPVSFIIPCHRVIRDTGVINFYRWGSTRKRLMLGWEAAKKESV
jgi:AraC family transcriptional regulator of adaptative response/methylated-DNA-[protein]-cysteine methyltransferase